METLLLADLYSFKKIEECSFYRVKYEGWFQTNTDNEKQIKWELCADVFKGKFRGPRRKFLLENTRVNRNKLLYPEHRKKSTQTSS